MPLYSHIFEDRRLSRQKYKPSLLHHSSPFIVLKMMIILSVDNIYWAIYINQSALPHSPPKIIELTTIFLNNNFVFLRFIFN